MIRTDGRPPAIPATRAWGVRLALVTAAVSGVAIFVNGYAVGRFDDATSYTTVKNLVAALLLGGLVAVATARGSAAGWTPPRSRRARAGLVAVGVIGGGIPFVLFFEGLGQAASTDAALLHKTLVVWVALLAVLFLRERIGPMHVLAIGAIVAGQLVLGDPGGLALGSGEAMILAATLLWSVEVVLAKRLLRELSPLTVGSSRLGIGVVLLLGWLGVTGELSELWALDVSQWGWALLTGLLLTGYVTSWFAALARAAAIDVTAVLVAGALVTAVLEAAFRDASLRPDLLGLALIGAGAALVVAAAGRDRTRGVSTAPVAG